MSAHTLLLGGARSGKSRAAEQRALAWLQRPGAEALLLVTAQAGDVEMQQRIARHQADRALRVSALQVQEAQGADLPALLRQHSRPDCLLLVDCLTLWLTQLMLPLQGEPDLRPLPDLLAALDAAPGPVLLVSNEIGLGVLPLSREARAFVDELGRLHQDIARRCAQVSLLVAGLELPLKGAPS